MGFVQIICAIEFYRIGAISENAPKPHDAIEVYTKAQVTRGYTLLYIKCGKTAHQYEKGHRDFFSNTTLSPTVYKYTNYIL